MDDIQYLKNRGRSAVKHDTQFANALLRLLDRVKELEAHAPRQAVALKRARARARKAEARVAELEERRYD